MVVPLQNSADTSGVNNILIYELIEVYIVNRQLPGFCLALTLRFYLAPLACLEQAFVDW